MFFNLPYKMECENCKYLKAEISGIRLHYFCEHPNSARGRFMEDCEYWEEEKE